MAKSRLADRQKAVSAINKTGALLVFPIKNKKEPASIWSVLYPKTVMRWEWDEDGDDRVARLWYTRGELSDSRQVVYTKWFQGRATYFSREIFVLLLAYFETAKQESSLGNRDAREILDILESDSPLSPKQIKAMTDLQGRDYESQYNRALKALWNPLLVVAFGEIEDSSFPSLAIGATKTLYEDLWTEALEISSEEAARSLEKQLGKDNVFWKFAQKTKKQLG